MRENLFASLCESQPIKEPELKLTDLTNSEPMNSQPMNSERGHRDGGSDSVGGYY